jgi:hypothetical protein
MPLSTLAETFDGAKMITYPYLLGLLNAYCAEDATEEISFNCAYNPFLSRHHKLTKEQRREADRLRKVTERLSAKPSYPLGDRRGRAFGSQLFEHIKTRFKSPNASLLKHGMIHEVPEAFMRDRGITFDECIKWFGAPSLMLSMQAGAFVSKGPEADLKRAACAQLLAELERPSATGVALERGEIEAAELFSACLGGLPEGIALRRWSTRQAILSDERFFRVAALTGLIWQAAFLYAFLCHDGPESLRFSPAPVAAGASLMSSAPAWIEALAALEVRFHTEPRGSRGPKSKTMAIAAMLAKARDPDLGVDASNRMLRKLSRGEKPLTYADVTKICELTEAALTGACESTDWKTPLFLVLVHGHFAGFFGYLERVWANSARSRQQPEILADIHEVWADWPILLDHVIASQRRIYADHGL